MSIKLRPVEVNQGGKPINWMDGRRVPIVIVGDEETRGASDGRRKIRKEFKIESFAVAAAAERSLEVGLVLIGALMRCCVSLSVLKGCSSDKQALC